jgi:hypothetical protein
MTRSYVIEKCNGRPLVRYVSERLEFRRAAIELLRTDGLLEIQACPTRGDAYTVTMTRADFERCFPKVTKTASWASGRYSYPTFPEAARPYVTRGTPPARRARGNHAINQPAAALRHPFPSTEGIPDVAQWAAVWSRYVGAPMESTAYLDLVEAWRNAWRPDRVRFLLVAESHMGELDGDAGVLVARTPTGTTAVPECQRSVGAERRRPRKLRAGGHEI